MGARHARIVDEEHRRDRKPPQHVEGAQPRGRSIDWPGRPSDGRFAGRRTRVIWSVPTSLPLVAVTFDDGPDPRFTPRVLDALEAAGANATFNVMGHNAVTHAPLLRRAVASGHEIGNHTWTHDDLALADPATVEAQLLRGRDAITSLTSAPVT